jgi:putative ABC transport system substrate-binding protein
MSTQGQWQFVGSVPENYERYLVPSIFDPWASDLVEVAAPQPGERVVDIACGTGIVARTAAQRVGSGGRVVGLDLSVPMLEAARAAAAAQGATSSVPIVMGAVADPVGSGFVTSLARPGGNVTGVSLLMTDLIGKQIQLLREVAPRASRIGVISLGGRPHDSSMKEAEASATRHRVTVHRIVLREPLRLDDLALQLRMGRFDAVLGLANPALDDVRARIVEIVNAQRLPSVFALTYWAEAGGLMSYSADLYAVQRLAATFVDKILKGANPANLPIEQPTKVEFVINLKTAKALGLTIPPSLLLRADQVI